MEKDFIDKNQWIIVCKIWGYNKGASRKQKKVITE